MDNKQRLVDYVKNMPQPGSGGCNRSILGACNVGVAHSLSDNNIVHIILSNLINPGPETESAIRRAIQRSRRDVPMSSGQRQEPILAKTARPPIASNRSFATYLSSVPISMDEARERSPIKIEESPEGQFRQALSTLFNPDDILFVGDKFDKKSIASYGGLISHSSPPFWIPNPLDGLPHLTKSGSESYRCDAAVVRWKYLVAEFDDMPIENQLALWLNIDLPVAALTYSGGKSIHALIYVDASKDEFPAVRKFYKQEITSLGADPACGNPARLSRTPGHFRADKQKVQQLLFLSSPKQLEEKYARSKRSSHEGSSTAEEG